MSFSKAVALKVHKRTHIGEYPFSCTECTEKFISKKLLIKHEISHREPVVPSVPVPVPVEMDLSIEEDKHIDVENVETPKKNPEPVVEETELEIKEPVVKKVVDVYDLPPLNLSDSDSDEDEKTDEKKIKETLSE